MFDFIEFKALVTVIEGFKLLFDQLLVIFFFRTMLQEKREIKEVFGREVPGTKCYALS